MQGKDQACLVEGIPLPVPAFPGSDFSGTPCIELWIVLDCSLPHFNTGSGTGGACNLRSSHLQGHQAMFTLLLAHTSVFLLLSRSRDDRWPWSSPLSHCRSVCNSVLHIVVTQTILCMDHIMRSRMLSAARRPFHDLTSFFHSCSGRKGPDNCMPETPHARVRIFCANSGESRGTGACERF